MGSSESVEISPQLAGEVLKQIIEAPLPVGLSSTKQTKPSKPSPPYNIWFLGGQHFGKTALMNTILHSLRIAASEPRSVPTFKTVGLTAGMGADHGTMCVEDRPVQDVLDRKDTNFRFLDTPGIVNKKDVSQDRLGKYCRGLLQNNGPNGVEDIESPEHAPDVFIIVGSLGQEHTAEQNACVNDANLMLRRMGYSEDVIYVFTFKDQNKRSGKGAIDFSDDTFEICNYNQRAATPNVYDGQTSVTALQILQAALMKAKQRRLRLNNLQKYASHPS